MYNSRLNAECEKALIFSWYAYINMITSVGDKFHWEHFYKW